MTRSSRWRWGVAVVCTTLAILVVPVALDLLVKGARRVFGYLAIDAFSYLTAARNGLDLGGLTSVG